MLALLGGVRLQSARRRAISRGITLVLRECIAWASAAAAASLDWTWLSQYYIIPLIWPSGSLDVDLQPSTKFYGLTVYPA